MAGYLRAEPQRIDAWSTWSGDQRWTPSAYFDGTETGWYDSGYEHVRHHRDRADAAADFIHRLAAWLAERRVIGSDETPERTKFVSRPRAEVPFQRASNPSARGRLR